jgi:hypothetical protein
VGKTRQILALLAFLALSTFAQALVTTVSAENNGAGDPQGSDAGWSGGGFGG